MKISKFSRAYLDELCQPIGGLEKIKKNREGMVYLRAKLRKLNSTNTDSEIRNNLRKDLFLLNSILTKDKSPQQKAVLVLLGGRDIWRREVEEL